MLTVSSGGFAQNLLLDEHGNLKISDFGLSSLYIGDAEEGASRTELLHTTCGTPNYVAPEVLSDQGYDGKKADVWSIGVILYVLLAGFLPFDESTIVALFAKIQAADFTYPSWFTPETRALLDLMLVADPKQRITLTQIKAHPWFQGAAGALEHVAPPVPTDAQMAAAVGDEDHEDLDDHEHEATEPAKLNAFDLVTQSGGFMLDRMFSPEIFYSVPGMEQGAADAAAADAKKVGGAILFGGSTGKTKCFHFTATDITPQDLTAACVTALQEMGFTFDRSVEVMTRSGIAHAHKVSPKGMLGMSLQAFTVSPHLSLLEIKKGKGDLLEWNAAYSELVEKRIAHLLNKLREA
jgi:hypothetical protein